MVKNICIRESYTDKTGVERTSWNTIGCLIEGKDGKQYVKIYHMPGVLCSVFEPKPKGDAKPKESQDNLEF